jgi:N6-L-threonylcarbamoyladenine synthase
MELFLGIDTSCYTTSLAVVDGEGNLLFEARRLLVTPKGGRGLAQNEAVFQHINNLPELFTQIFSMMAADQLKGIAASVRPRPVEGSYMPVFRVARSYGKSLSAILGVPFFGTSHQEGHLSAGLWSAQGPKENEFLAVHLSGGTTELLRVTSVSGSGVFGIDLLGGTTDLHAGQFVDRVGVALGLAFPAGPQLEQLAGEEQSGDPHSNSVSIPSSVKGYEVSFSGPETHALRLIEKNTPKYLVARAVENCIAASLEKVIRKAVTDTVINEVLVVGGVSANKFIREKLSARLHQKSVGARLYFASPGLSSDNAVGTALIGRQRLRTKNRWK